MSFVRQCKSEICGVCSFSNPIIKEQMNLFPYSERRRGDQGGHSPQSAAPLTIKKKKKKSIHSEDLHLSRCTHHNEVVQRAVSDGIGKQIA